MTNFQILTTTFTSTIFSWEYYCDFKKIKVNTFKIKIQLNILNSLLWEKDIEEKFLVLVKTYPEVRALLPILLAVRHNFWDVFDKNSKIIKNMASLFSHKDELTEIGEKQIILFFRESWLKEVFENKYISNLHDYVFWIETWLDTNARKNRTGVLMEWLVEDFIKEFCEKNGFEYREQATISFIKSNWNIDMKSDKSSRRFDFAVYSPQKHKVFLLEVNYYGWWWSKLKAVAWEFAGLYDFMQEQNIPFYWITDGLGWNTALKPLEEAYIKMNGNIYNLEMLKNWILNELIK